MGLLAACAGAPDRDISVDPEFVPVENVDAPPPAEAPSAEPVLIDPPAEPPRRGLLALLRRAPPPQSESEPVASLPPPDPPPVPDYLVGELPPQPEPAAWPQPSTRPRPFGFLFKRVPGEVEAPADAPESEVILATAPADEAEPAGETEIELAMLADPAAAANAPPERRGWLFGRSRRESADQPATAAVGGPPPFGAVFEACGVSKRQMGVEVARSPGVGQYRLYDSEPSSLAPRAQFITGFKDGCARQFTASLALFGSAAVHEATRYNPLNTSPYSGTDIAYEKVKSRVCRVRRGEFCPQDKIDRLEREAAFVSVYRSFGTTGEWMELFLHKGQLVAHQTQGR